ncbi:MAG: preprotein translocase subunit SecG [Nitrospina sp.]|nr:preprotein translocase subunit SecG [Nitrospina sp.]
MTTLITVLHVIAALFLILVVLLQQGKGASMGAAFGAGSSQTMFGSSGAGNLLTKLTAGAAALFMITSLTLATLSKTEQRDSVIQQQVEETAPAAGEAGDSSQSE